MQNQKYPKIIFVQFQGKGRDEFLQAETSFDRIPDDGVLAVYELKELKTRKTEFTFSNPRPKRAE